MVMVMVMMMVINFCHWEASPVPKLLRLSRPVRLPSPVVLPRRSSHHILWRVEEEEEEEEEK